MIEALFQQLQDGVSFTKTSLVHFSNHTHTTVTTTTTAALGPQDRVLFSGCSAGARRVALSLPRAPTSRLPSPPPPSVLACGALPQPASPT